MNSKEKIELLLSELKQVSHLEIFQKTSDLKRFSKDFFDYSPILINELKDCLADIVVRPLSLDAIIVVAEMCNKYSTPLTLRGSGTGNYGHCVPLNGGVVMVMSGLRKIRNFDSKSGEVTVESGCLLRDINDELIKYGRQLRLLPSTWRSASIGGFIAGGSGGIGSIADLISLANLESTGIEAIIVGRALYDGSIDLKEAQLTLKNIAIQDSFHDKDKFVV